MKHDYNPPPENSKLPEKPTLAPPKIVDYRTSKVHERPEPTMKSPQPRGGLIFSTSEPITFTSDNSERNGTYLEEGKKSKGGVNGPPTIPRPTEPPKGQGIKAGLTKISIDEMIQRDYPSDFNRIAWLLKNNINGSWGELMTFLNRLLLDQNKEK